MRPSESVLSLIGHTPLVSLHRLAPQGTFLLAKAEYLNPSGSVKDRVALALVETAEADGKLKAGDTIVEASAGNMGLSLALVAATKGYRLVLAMPETVDLEHRQRLLLLGAELVLTPSGRGMTGAQEVVQEMAEKNGYYHPQVFANPTTAEVHRRTTAVEILKATEGKIDAFVAGIGTGGTITGVGEVLKREIPRVLIIGVEPARSPLLSRGVAGSHGIPGLGTPFIPAILNRDIIDSIITVDDDEAKNMALALNREEGLLAGISSGANVFAACKVAQGLGGGKTVVTILPDGGEKYLNQMLYSESPAEAWRKGR